MAHLNQHLLHHSVDHITLLNIFLSIDLEFAHHLNGQVAELLIFIEADLYLLGLHIFSTRLHDTTSGIHRLTWISWLLLLILRGWVEWRI